MNIEILNFNLPYTDTIDLIKNLLFPSIGTVIGVYIGYRLSLVQQRNLTRQQQIDTYMKFLEEVYSEIFKSSYSNELTAFARHYSNALTHRSVHILLYLDQKMREPFDDISNNLISALNDLADNPTKEGVKEFNTRYGQLLPKLYKILGPVYKGFESRFWKR